MDSNYRRKNRPKFSFLRVDRHRFQLVRFKKLQALLPELDQLGWNYKKSRDGRAKNAAECEYRQTEAHAGRNCIKQFCPLCLGRCIMRTKAQTVSKCHVHNGPLVSCNFRLYNGVVFSNSWQITPRTTWLFEKDAKKGCSCEHPYIKVFRRMIPISSLPVYRLGAPYQH